MKALCRLTREPFAHSHVEIGNFLASRAGHVTINVHSLLYLKVGEMAVALGKLVKQSLVQINLRAGSTGRIASSS